MNICGRDLSLYILTFIFGLFLSTDAFATTKFYLFLNDAQQKTDCDFLEIKNSQALCTAKNLLITYDLAKILKVEVVNKGVSTLFQPITQETTQKINELNSTEKNSQHASGQEKSKQKRFAFLSDSAQAAIEKFTNPNGKITVNTILSISGFVVFLIGSIGFLIATFRAGILWGLCCLLLPFVSFIFLFVHWKAAAKPFFVSLLGIAILFLGSMQPFSGQTVQSIVKFTSTPTQDNTIKNTGNFQCKGKVYCSEMASCAEAKFYLRNCPGTKLDGNNDGVPCEKQWCGH